LTRSCRSGTTGKHHRPAVPEVSRGNERHTRGDILRAHAALLDSIDQIRRLEIGRDELHDARSWDLVLIMAFDSVDALRAYQAHPEHVALMNFNDRFGKGRGVRGVHQNRAGATNRE
jgi:Stress responsive A/B Barrel Domain